MAMIIHMLMGLVATLFVYTDAKKRGQGAIMVLLWSVGSAVAPYVILPLYLLLGRKTKQQNQYDDNDVIDIEATVVEEIVVEETINCTSCGSKVKTDFLVCPYCQEPIGTCKRNN